LLVNIGSLLVVSQSPSILTIFCHLFSWKS